MTQTEAFLSNGPTNSVPGESKKNQIVKKKRTTLSSVKQRLKTTMLYGLFQIPLTQTHPVIVNIVAETFCHITVPCTCAPKKIQK